MDWTSVVVLCLCTVKASNADPCTSDSRLPDLPLRQVTTILQYGETPLCDRYLENKWYKANRTDMPTTAPEMGACGTHNPIWLADSLPPHDGTEHELKACVRGHIDSCFESIYIKVKNCGNFNVYFLKSTRACHYAYCFNTKKAQDAPDIKVSNVVAEYSSLKWNMLYEKFYVPCLTYKCTFKGHRDKKYCYQVNWYVDGTIVFESQVVTTEFAEISDNKFINKDVYKLNTLVTTPRIQIERQGKGTVRFRNTVPFACTFMHGKPSFNCKSYILMVNPSSRECGEKITGGNRCNKEIDGYDISKINSYYNNGKWKTEYSMEVIHQTLMPFSSQDSRFRIRLEMIGSSGHMVVWEPDVVLPDIFVDVYDKKKLSIWKGKHCSAVSVLRQFDSRSFGLYMQGVFILYRNQKAIQEVQIKTTQYSGRMTTPCAVAARAGQDVFVLDRCMGRKFESFISRGDGVLEVIKLTERSYQIIFPSGTIGKVDISNNFKFTNVVIYPFENDVQRTEGLCGNLDGSNNQFDMQLRNKPGSFDTGNSPNRFLKSWRPIPYEDLFSYRETVYTNLKSLDISKIQLCICHLNSKERQTYSEQESSTITCRYETYAECRQTKTNFRLVAPTRTTQTPTTLPSTTKTPITVASIASPSRTTTLTTVASSLTTEAATPITFTVTTPTAVTSSSPYFAASGTAMVSKATSTLKTQMSVKTTTSTLEKLFSTTYENHSETEILVENEPLSEAAICFTPTATIIIVSLIVAVFCALIITIIVIFYKSRRHKPREATLKKQENGDGNLETVYNVIVNECKTEIGSSDTKDTEMPKSDSTAEMLLGGSSAEVPGSESIYHDITDISADINDSASPSTMGPESQMILSAGEVTLKKQGNDDGNLQAVYNVIVDECKMEIGMSETKDTEMPKSGSVAETLMSGSSAEVAGSESIYHDITDNSVYENAHASTALNN